MRHFQRIADITLAEAIRRGDITPVHNKNGRGYDAGGTFYHSGTEAMRAWQKRKDEAIEQDRVNALRKWQNAQVQAIRSGDDVRVSLPNGDVLQMTIRTYRQRVFDLEDMFGCEIVLRSEAD